MQSLIHLYNAALAELGGDQIPLNISPIEGDAVGAICQNIFPHVLDTVLESHEWGFAKSRAILALVPSKVPYSHTYQFKYGIPSDCLRPLLVLPCHNWGGMPGENYPLSYEIEGEYLLCNVEQAELLYIARVSEPKRWPAYFATVLVMKMAAGLATARNNDKQQKQMYEQKYEYELAKACAKDRAMNKPRGRVSAWSSARGNTMNIWWQ